MTRKTDLSRFTKIQDSQLKWPHWIFQEICILLLHAYILYKFNFRVRGRENRPKGFQSYIVACNHVSVMDPPMVSIALNYQPISFLAKMELFEHPLMRLYNVLMSSIAVNREKLELSTVKSAFKVLKHGQWALGIFPEGTRQKDGSPGEAKRGVAYFAKSAWKPVLPMGVVHYTPPHGRKIAEIRVGKLIPPEEDMDALAQKIQDAIAELIAEPPQTKR